MTKKKPRRKYTKEFKLEAIQLAESRGNASEVARNLGMEQNLLNRYPHWGGLVIRDSGHGLVQS